ncbi:MAG: transketolase, partial [Candidatus Dormibacteraceae bacterium]
PGMPLGAAAAAYALWANHMRHDPADPKWYGRDRFVLSAGHASMLLYSLLHLTGTVAVNPAYETVGELSVKLDDIERFRQLDSKCPGHPEYRWTSGVETTTGPLGQGIATSVGMAIASKFLGAHYNRPDFPIFDFDAYALCGDGCLMEGISHEAASLAGHLKLDNLCWIYDNTHSTIEGPTSLTYDDDVATRFLGYGWNVTRVGNANDLAMVARALRVFKKEVDRPTLIIVDSHIGYGAPHKEDTSAAHGEPLGPEEVRETKEFYGWPEDAQVLVPDGVREHFEEGIGKRGAQARLHWEALYEDYKKAYPEQAEQLRLMQWRELPPGWDQLIPTFPADPKGLAGRESSAQVLNAIAERVPWLLGGAGDLAPSTKTRLTFEGAGDFEAGQWAGRNFHFGIREHAMGAIVNGLSLSKLRAFGAGFFIFTEYMKQPLRLSALMEIPTIFVFTHDSIGVGEDGPTHQPVEQLAALRAVPGLLEFRPGDANEVAETWRCVMQLSHDPAVIVLSRQSMPTFDRSKYAAARGVARGAYVLSDPGQGDPEVILMATGTEVSLIVSAGEALAARGIRARLVSMPSWGLFERQPKEYRDAVLPPQVTARVAVEQESSFGWERYTGLQGAVIAMHTFGTSAPLKDVVKRFGFTPERVTEAALAQLGRAL